MNKVIRIDGNTFDDIDGFYEEAYRVLTSGLDWPVAHNLDALNDVLYGGFGVFGPREPVVLQWTNFSKSRKDLGVGPSITYYDQRASGLIGNRSEFFRRKADDLRAGIGETFMDTLLQMIREHPEISLITEG